MNFSDIRGCSSQAEFSHSSEFLAIVKGIKLTIHESADMGLVRSYSLIDQVTKLEWSLDDSLILCAQAKRGFIQVFNIKDPRWECKITLGPCGLSGAWLAPDSRHIITICSLQIRLNAWSLLEKEVLSMQNPKFSNKGIAFSKCRQFTAVLKRANCQDSLVIFDNWFNPVSNFPLKTLETEDIYWTNDNFYIIAYDPSSWVVYAPTGELVYEYASNSSQLFKSVQSINGCYSAISTCDNKIKVIHHITWASLYEMMLTIQVSEKEGIIYNEVETLEKGKLSYNYGMVEGTMKLGIVEGERKPGIVKWSYNERMIACKFGKGYIDACPGTVFIWDVVLRSLKAVLVHRQSVKAIEWCPSCLICAIVTGSNRIYLWSEDGASVCDLPFGTFYVDRELSLSKLLWSENGIYLQAREKANLVVAYPQLEEFSR